MYQVHINPVIHDRIIWRGCVDAGSELRSGLNNDEYLGVISDETLINDRCPVKPATARVKLVMTGQEWVFEGRVDTIPDLQSIQDDARKDSLLKWADKAQCVALYPGTTLR